MKILLINKFHSRRDGAARAYFDTAEILESHGHEVAFFAMRGENDEPTPWSKYFLDPVDYNTTHSIAQKWQIVKDIWWNREAQRRLEALLDEFRPDIAHLHVIYHQLSPSIIATLKKRGILMVMTLHDYKLICPNYSMYVRGRVWEGGPVRCMVDRCVKDSFGKSAVCAIEHWFHRAIEIYDRVDAYIAPSRFLIEKFRKHKFKKEVFYVPQPIFERDRIEGDLYDASSPLLYAGRLSQEKGVDVAIRAMKDLPGERMEIAGSGPERERLGVLSEELHAQDRVSFLGHLSQADLREKIARAKAMLIPSVWYENMPYALLEALAAGKIIIGSNIGGIGERIVNRDNGFLFRAGDPEDLVRIVRSLSHIDIQSMQQRARESISDLSPEIYYGKIFGIYQEIIEGKKTAQ